VPLLYLRAQAMTERDVTFGADETTDALVSFDMALPRLSSLLAYLRSGSNSQFGPVVCKPIPDSQDSRVCWYWCGNEQFICGSTRDPGGVERCRQSRAANMDAAYRAFEGVREITAAADQLRDARAALDAIKALDLLRHRGVDVGEVVIVHGRLVRSPPKRKVASAADGEPSEGWFS
jgi:hypothetical protein